RFLARAATDVLGKSAGELGVAGSLDGPAPRLLDDREGASRGARWELRRAAFRRNGVPHTLLVITDVGRALRVEERLAWQRLVRVLSHEVNNALAAIQSIASSQATVLGRTERASDWEADLRSGLDVVGRRADSLARFLAAYARLARLPPPVPREVDV